MTDLRVERAGLEDIAVIMQMERQPGYEEHVTGSSADEHRKAMADPSTLYLMAYDGKTPVGFAILAVVEPPHNNMILRRIAVGQAGKGVGTRFMLALMDYVFTSSATHRLFLHVYVHNTRAERVYRNVGFTTEGVLRENRLRPDGSYASMTVMSILRPEWDARKKQPAER